MGGALGTGVSGVGLDVGFLCDGGWPSPGGGEGHTRDLARGLLARGHRVHVLCVEHDGSLAPWRVADDEREGVSVRRMGAPAPARTLADLVHDARAMDVVLAWMAEVPCDAIHAHATRDLRPSALQAVADMGRPLVGEPGDPGLACACGLALHAAHAGHDALACARRHWPRLLPSGGGEPRGPRGEGLADDAAAVRAFVERTRELALLPQRVARIDARADAEGRAARVLEHERLYAELTLSITGRLPALAHPIPGLEAPPAAKAAPPAPRAGLLGRLFGRDRRS